MLHWQNKHAVPAGKTSCHQGLTGCRCCETQRATRRFKSTLISVQTCDTQSRVFGKDPAALRQEHRQLHADHVRKSDIVFTLTLLNRERRTEEAGYDSLFSHGYVISACTHIRNQGFLTSRHSKSAHVRTEQRCLNSTR